MYHKKSGKIITNDEFIERLCRLFEREGTDFWWTFPVEELMGRKLLQKLDLNPEDLQKGDDSGTSWSSVLPVGRADLYLEGMD